MKRILSIACLFALLLMVGCSSTDETTAAPGAMSATNCPGDCGAGCTGDCEDCTGECLTGQKCDASQCSTCPSASKCDTAATKCEPKSCSGCPSAGTCPSQK
jgi:hypothetical protein